MTEQQKNIKYVTGNILDVQNNGPRQVMLFAVDDSGEFGSGRLFRSLTDRYPDIVDKYESLTDLELGDARVVYESQLLMVIFLIVLSSDDRNHIGESVMEKALKQSAALVKNIPNVIVNIPRIGYGTDLPFRRVEDMLQKHFLDMNIPCSVFHYRSTERKDATRTNTNRFNRAGSPLPAKRRRKPIPTTADFEDDESSSSSSCESSEGEYQPSDDEDDRKKVSSSSEDDMATDENEDVDDSESEAEAKAFVRIRAREKENKKKETKRKEGDKDANEKDTKIWKNTRPFHGGNSLQKKEKVKLPSPNRPSPVVHNPVSMITTLDSTKYIKNGIISLIDVPQELKNEYSDFIMKKGGEAVFDGVDLSKVTLSVIHSPDLQKDKERLHEYKKKFNSDCVHVSSDYIGQLIVNKLAPYRIDSYLL